MKAAEFFDSFQEIHSLHNDFPLNLKAEEKVQLWELAKKHRPSVVLDTWRRFRKAKPSKPVRWFLEDFAELMRDPEESGPLTAEEYFGRMGMRLVPPEKLPPADELRRIREEEAIPGLRRLLAVIQDPEARARVLQARELEVSM